MDSKNKAAKAPRKTSGQEDRSEAEYDEDESDDHLYVPDNIFKLDVDIQGDWKQKGVTLGSILPQSPEDE